MCYPRFTLSICKAANRRKGNQMKYNALFVITITFFFLLSAVVSSSPAKEVNLTELIPLALDHNPTIDIAKQQFNQSTGQLTQAKSGYLPRLTVNAGVAQTHIKDLIPEDEDTVLGTNLSASQLIYDFGQTTGLIDSSKYNREAARSNLEQNLQDVVFLVKNSYYSALERIHLVAVSEQAVSTYEQHLYRARKYFEAGVRTQIDITNAELELANAQLDLLRTNSRVKTALVKLEQVIGIKPNGGDYTLKTDDKPLANLADNMPVLAGPLDQLLDTASKNRPGLAQLEQLLKSAGASLKQARGEYWPTLTADAFYDGYDTNLHVLNDQWQVGAGLTWELFSGFETEGRVAESKGRMMEISSSKHELELAIIQDVTDSFLRAEEHRDSVKIAQLAMKLAKRNLELAEGRYKAGLGDMLEFNDGQLNYTRSQSDLVANYFAYLISLARIDRAVGITPEISSEKVTQLLQ